MINNVTLMGRLTADPEVKKVGKDDLSVVKFCVAVDRNGKDAGCDFIYCEAWRATADFIGTYFEKGEMIALTGAIKVDSYEDKDKNKRTATVVVVNNVSFCGGKSNKSDKPATAKKASKKKPSKEEIAEMIANGDIELPF